MTTTKKKEDQRKLGYFESIERGNLGGGGGLLSDLWSLSFVHHHHRVI
jgi:hypothetical protein